MGTPIDNLPDHRVAESSRPTGRDSALAAIAVLVQHSLPIPGYNIGLAGVKLFFVLSGFLITGILLRERVAYDAGVSLSRVLMIFYTRRLSGSFHSTTSPSSWRS